MSLENAERVIKNLAAHNKATPKCDQYHDIHYNTVIKSTLTIRPRTSSDNYTMTQARRIKCRSLYAVLNYFSEIIIKSPNYVEIYYAVCLFYEIIMESAGLSDHVFGHQTMHVYVTR